MEGDKTKRGQELDTAIKNQKAAEDAYGRLVAEKSSWDTEKSAWLKEKLALETEKSS